MTKTTVTPTDVPEVFPKLIETIEGIDPRGYKRIEIMQTGTGNLYFRVYLKRLDIPDKVSIGYPTREECNTAKEKYLATGKLDTFYMPQKPKKGGKK